MNKLTLLLVSYDGYSDMWPAFFECKKKFWADCPYPIVLANNDKRFALDGLEVINCGKEAQWSTRTRKALESIKTKYVMFLLEDLFISAHVNTLHIENAIQLMENDNLDYYKIMNFSRIKTPNYNGTDYLHIIPASLPYGISLQASIWNKDYFLKMVGEDDYNPWVFEVQRLEEEQQTSEPDKLLGVFDNRNILNICHMVVQGKYLPKSVKRMQQLGIEVDIRSRGIMTWKENLIYSIKSNIAPLTNRHPLLRKVLRTIGPSSVVEQNRKHK